MDYKRVELSVGIFLLIGLASLAYLSFKLGHVKIWGSTDYTVYATFSNVGGLKARATVTVAGVPIGRVERIQLKDGTALVTLSIYSGVKLEEDAIASIKTTGIVGDKYVAISPGASDQFIPINGKINDTQSPVDIEELIGKFMFGKV
jgi:phospholipid/cholesterol/gamma-HCH transport system substrate-binding protein